jgi:hypothetical protein
MRDGMLEHQRGSADGQSKTAQTVLPQSKVKKVLGKPHEGSLGGLLGVNKSLDKVRQRYYWVHKRGKSRCQQCDKCAASLGPKPRARA